MIKFLLDTDICVFVLSGRQPSASRRLLSFAATEVAISSVTQGEMYSGAARSEDPERSRKKQYDFFAHYVRLPYDHAAAQQYGLIDGFLKRNGIAIGPMDTQIASIALANNITLVTHNIRHFSRVPDLIIEDWTIA